MGEITKIKVNGDPESSYQLYPRNEEFAKRAGGENGGSNVQPDWNQNDDTQPDYVKNRPFYTGDPTENVLFNGSFVFTITGMGPMGERGVYNGATDFSPEVGQTYQVSWDGAVYSCVGTEYNSLIALGNLSIMNFGSDTGEPFLMTFGTGSINIYTWPVGSSHTISIGKTVVPVVKIDPKYLFQPNWNQNDDTQPDYVKNRPFYTGDPVETVLVEESTVSFVEKNGLYMAQFPSTFVATVGETYKVSWDGTVYECTCADSNGFIVIGNFSLAGAGSDTGEPFIMDVTNGGRINIATADTSASHTVSISGFVSGVVKIDEKYIPDTIATKSDVDEKLGNCIKTVNGTSPDASGNVEVQTISEDVLSTNQYGNVIIVKNGVVFKNRLDQYGTASIGKSNVAFLVKKGETSNDMDTIFAFCAAGDANNGFSSDAICLSRNGINFNSENVVIRSFKPGNYSVGVIQLNGSTSHGVMVEITKDACFVLPSSTENSAKKFKITVDDSGALTATEVT